MNNSPIEMYRIMVVVKFKPAMWRGFNYLAMFNHDYSPMHAVTDH